MLDVVAAIDKRRFRESSSSSSPPESTETDQQATDPAQVTPPVEAPADAHSPRSNSTVELISTNTSPKATTSTLPSTAIAPGSSTTTVETGSLALPSTKAPLQRSKRASLRGPRVQGAVSKVEGIKNEDEKAEEGEKRGKTPEGEKSDQEAEKFEECL